MSREQQGLRTKRSQWDEHLGNEPLRKQVALYLMLGAHEVKN